MTGLTSFQAGRCMEQQDFSNPRESLRSSTGSLHCQRNRLSVLDSKTSSGLLRWLSGKESTCQCRRCWFNPCVWKIPWRSKWLSTSIFLPRKFHGQRGLTGYKPWGRKESDMTEQLTPTNTHTHDYIKLYCESESRSVMEFSRPE